MRGNDSGRGLRIAAVAAFLGITIGGWAGHGMAQRAVPTEHSGLEVHGLGDVPADSMAAQVGLDGHRLQLRAITIAPGGAIARHTHATRPGLVYVLEGTWTEGRPAGERQVAGGGVIVEDDATEHWFFNTGDEPATALVCDIVPAGKSP